MGWGGESLFSGHTHIPSSDPSVLTSFPLAYASAPALGLWMSSLNYLQSLTIPSISFSLQSSPGLSLLPNTPKQPQKGMSCV
jgi:ABC-type nitrate/sulfonate/bicarbonate transport system permease component